MDNAFAKRGYFLAVLMLSILLRTLILFSYTRRCSAIDFTILRVNSLINLFLLYFPLEK